MPVPLYNFSFVRKKELRHKLLIIIASFLALLVALQFVLMFLLCPVFVTSSSMEPKLRQDSAVFVLPLSPSRPGFFSTDTIERGSIVHLTSLHPSQKSGFQKAINFICAMVTFQQYRPYENVDGRHSGDEMYRVVGFPGDTLYLKDYVVYMRQGGDSHFLTEFELSSVEYDIFIQNISTDWDMSIGIQGNTEQIVLKQDEYFLLCDNRLVATDSRLFGPVKEEFITGRALLQYFPLTDIRVVK